MLTVIHYVAGGLALAALVAFVVCMGASQQQLDPDRPPGERLTTLLIPVAARPSDFTGSGWRWRVRAYVAFGAVVPLVVLWGATA